MQPLNAIDAITPAVIRTHETLFGPFRLGRSWKLCASQYIGWMGSMFIPIPFLFLFFPSDGIPGFSAMRSVFLVLSIIMTLVTLVILYFCARMEMVSFEMIVTRGKFIAPMWRRYSARIWPWLGLKVAVGTVYGAILIALFASPARHLFGQLIASFPAVSAGEKPDPVAMQAFMTTYMLHMMSLQLVFASFFFLIKIPSTLLNDFVLPFYVLEDISLTDALRRGLDVIVADPVHCLLYCILKPILFVIGYIMQYIATMVVMIPIFLVFILLIVIGAVAMPHSGPGFGLLAGAAAVLAYLVFFVVIMYAMLFTFGYLIGLLEAFGIYFLAGRYPLLGNILDPGPGAPFTPPPVFPSKDEQRDDDGGPPMPMDPAVA